MRHFEGEHRRLARLEDVLPLVLLGPVDVAVVLPALAAQVLDVDGLEGTLGFWPVFSLWILQTLALNFCALSFVQKSESSNVHGTLGL